MQTQMILNRLRQRTWFSSVERVRDFHSVRHLCGDALRYRRSSGAINIRTPAKANTSATRRSSVSGLLQFPLKP